MKKRTEIRMLRLCAVLSLGLSLLIYCENPAGHAAAERTEARDSDAIRAAVVRALPLLIKASSVEYPKHRVCFSCHNQAVPAVALSVAQRHGFAIEPEILRTIAEHTEADLNGALDAYRQGKGQPGGVIRAGYALWALESAGWAPDETTAAVAQYLNAALGDRDHWQARSDRPPSESSDFTATALAIRGLLSYSAPAQPRRPDQIQGQSDDRPVAGSSIPAPARALRWLAQTKPRDTEDRAFKLWCLKQAGASAEEITAATLDLLETQRPDGGWSQLTATTTPAKAKVETHRDATIRDTTPAVTTEAHASDAYATGLALVALHLAGGVKTEVPAYRRGLEFLIRGQRDNGSWFVKSRSHPFQPYFESGFPHGPDQFISTAASGWAVAALALASKAP